MRLPKSICPNAILPVTEDVAFVHVQHPKSREEQPDVYTFQDPRLIDRYAIRCLGFKYSSYSAKRPGDVFPKVQCGTISDQPLSLQQQHDIYAAELARLRRSGLPLPGIFTVIPENAANLYIEIDALKQHSAQDIMVVSEMINPLPTNTHNRQQVIEQANISIQALKRYLSDSFTPDRIAGKGLYFNDIFYEHQFIYGTPADRFQPRFYMVDIGGNFESAHNQHRQAELSDEIFNMSMDVARIIETCA